MKPIHGVPRHRQRFRPRQQSWLLQDFKRNSLPAAEFAARHGVGVSTRYAWRRRAEGTQRSMATAQPAHAMFQSIPLDQMLGATRSWVGEVSWPDGTQLRWNTQLSAAALQEVLVQRRRPC